MQQEDVLAVCDEGVSVFHVRYIETRGWRRSGGFTPGRFLRPSFPQLARRKARWVGRKDGSSISSRVGQRKRYVSRDFPRR